MSDLTKLLEGVNVEWKNLGEIAKITIGEFVHQNLQDKSAEFPVYNGGIAPTGFYCKYNNTGKKLIVSARGANAGYVNKTTTPYWAGNSCYSISITNENKVNWLFVYYFLKSNELNLIGNQQKGGIPAVSKKQMEMLKIPIPCPDNPEKSLKIQQEIVRILDRLSEETNQLTAALQKELQIHQKRYDFCREELFRFEGKEVEWKSLGDVAKKISSGGTPKTNIKTYYGGDIPWLRTQEVGYGDIWDTEIKITEQGLKDSSAKLIPVNCLILAMYGATVGRVSINKIPLSTNQACANIELDPNVLDYRYAFHYLRSNYKYIKSLGTGPQTNINAGIVKNLRIPKPLINNPKKSLQEQERIVKILDDFDAKTQAITSAIKKEIELRNKQYEYYRDRLLSFQSLETEAEAIQ